MAGFCEKDAESSVSMTTENLLNSWISINLLME